VERIAEYKASRPVPGTSGANRSLAAHADRGHAGGGAVTAVPAARRHYGRAAVELDVRGGPGGLGFVRGQGWDRSSGDLIMGAAVTNLLGAAVALPAEQRAPAFVFSDPGLDDRVRI